MSKTYASIYFHLVWGTKDRRQMIYPQLKDRLYAYVGGIVRNHGGKLLVIGGIPDHVHLLVSVPPMCCMPKLVQFIKKDSSRFMGKINGGVDMFVWQKGYSMFSVSVSMIPKLTKYIKKQAEHHEIFSYKKELEGLLQRHNLTCDPMDFY